MKAILPFISLSLLIINTLFSQTGERQLLTLCWDSSRSMENRDFSMEKDYLNRYFARHPRAEVNLLLFSNALWGRETFEVESGNWSGLEARLQEIQYDGGTSYEDLAVHSTDGDILLFTDGFQNMDTATPVFNGNLYIINSSPVFHTANLNLMAILNEADLVHLGGKQPPLSPINATAPALYSGRIYGDYAEATAIAIKVKGRETDPVYPGPDGSYSIEASPGDILVFSVPGGRPFEKPLGAYRNLDLWVEASGEIQLDEVVVTERLREAGEVTTTAYGAKSRDAVGYAVQSITGEQLPDAATDVASATQGKFSGVSLGQNDDLSQVELRPKSSILSNNYGLIVIDGVPMAQSNSSVYNTTSPVQNSAHIDPKNIASITVLKGLAATNRFGSLGANGAILITTKAATFSKAVPKKDLALLTDNLYEGKLSVSNKTVTTEYLRALKKGKNVAEAYKMYLEQRATYENEPAYFIDLFEFFRESSPELALRIATNILEKDGASLMELKALLYKARELKNAKLELQTAQKIRDDYPGKIQSYLDLALAHRDAGNMQLALNLLLGITEGTANPDLDFNPLEKTTGRELRNLLMQHGKGLDLSRVPRQYLNHIRYNARLIFDWNNPDAQFELQFVNPQKRFFTWEHTSGDNALRIREELEHGYGSEEFEIFGEGVAGNWLINVRYLGNMNTADPTPVFLRCRVEYDFGKPGQRAEEFVVRLHEAGTESQVAAITIK